MSEPQGSHLVVAIGRAKGSGGAMVGLELARRLNCRYLDREILVEAAARLNREPEALAGFDERCLGFWERTMAMALGTPEMPYVPPPVLADDRDLFHFEKAIMKEAAQRGPVVVVGRAGFAVLRDEPGLLSVFLHAPLKQRVERVMKALRLESEEEAEKLVLRTDRDRNQFMKTLYGLDRLDLQNYHLCLDTGRFGIEGTVDLLFQAASAVAGRLSGAAGD